MQPRGRECAIVFEVGFQRSYNNAGFQVKEIYADQGESERRIHNNAFVQDSVQDIEQ